MINGLFHTNYSTESIVEYPNKEFVNRFLKERLADVFISINSTHTYHLEAQIQKDENIVLRVFEYGFYHAVEHMDDKTILKFPEPHLYESVQTTERLVLPQAGGFDN